jgi:hypothetical protein
MQVQKLEQQSRRQLEVIRQLQAAARDQDTAMSQQIERLARTDGELARARLANRKLKGEFLEQTALLSGYGLAQVPGGPPSEASYKSTARTGSLNASDEHSQRMATPARKQDKADVQQLQYLTSALLFHEEGVCNL